MLLFFKISDKIRFYSKMILFSLIVSGVDIKINKYSLHKKLGLRCLLKINHCISQKPTLKSPLVDFKQG